MEQPAQPDDITSPRGSGRTLMGSVSSASSAPPQNCHSPTDHLKDCGAFDPCEEDEFWNIALNFHKDGCMSIQRSPLTKKEKFFNVLAGLTGATPQKEQSTPWRRVNLANMHRLYVRQLQIKLVSIAAHQQFDDDLGRSAMPRWGPTFQAYVQAVRDHEFMQQFSGNQYDPFIVDEARCHDSKVLAHFVDDAQGTRADAYEKSVAVAKHPIVPEQITREHPRAIPILSTRGKEHRRALSFRIFGFFVAGAFLVGPMWLLVLVRSVWVHLSVTTACVLAFGSTMVWWTATIETVLAGTFAYAAVLMVFVGVMMQELH